MLFKNNNQLDKPNKKFMDEVMVNVFGSGGPEAYHNKKIKGHIKKIIRQIGITDQKDKDLVSILVTKGYKLGIADSTERSIAAADYIKKHGDKHA